MKTLLFITISTFLVGGAQGQNNKIDTLSVFRITDSTAELELKKYDQESARQTGVPRCVQHYDRIFVVDNANNRYLVHYDFNQKKFYGKNFEQKVHPNSTAFPDIFSIIFDPATKKTNFIRGGG